MSPLPRALFAIAWLAMAAAPSSAAAQSPRPAPGVEPAAAGLHVARPRGAVLAVDESAAEAFVVAGDAPAPTPLRLDPTSGKAILWADYEALFLPLAAGSARFDVRVFDADTDAATPIGSDRAAMVALGPARRSGRLAVALDLAPGEHMLRIVVRAASRSAAAAAETIDEDETVLKVHVRAALEAAGPPADPSAAASDAALGVAAPLIVAPGPPVGGLGVGAQRAAASTTALGALNFAVGHGAHVFARAGVPVHVWSDYEAWWSADAAADGALRLAVVRAATIGGAAEAAPLAEDGRSFVFDGLGPRLLDGSLAARLVLDRPGTYDLVAVLTTTMQRGRQVGTVIDRVPFTIHVVGDASTTGQIAGRAYGLALGSEPDIDPAAAAAVPLEGVRVEAVDRSGQTAGEARTNAAGAYQIEGLEPGAYRVHAAPAPLNYLDQWWKHSAGPAGAAAVDVTVGETATGIDFRLAPGGTLTGRVTDGGGQGLGGIEIIVGAYRRAAAGSEPIAAFTDHAARVDGVLEGVDALLDPFAGALAADTVLETADVATQDQAPSEDHLAPVGRTKTNADGAYTLDRLPAGTLWVRAVDPEGKHLGEYFKDARRFADASPIRLAAGASVDSIDFTLEAGAVITGQVREESQLTVILPLAGMTVEAFGGNDTAAPVASAQTNRSGEYALGPLPPGAYLVRASAPDGRFAAEWWKEAAAASDATPVQLDDGMTAEHIDFTLAKPAPQATIHVQPMSTGLTVGATAELTVNVADVANLGAFETTLRWDPAIVAVEGIALGDFLASTGRQVVPVTPVIDNTVGLATFGAASYGQAPGPSGGGVLFALKVKGLAIGRTALTIAEGSVLTDVRAQPIAHVLGGAKIAVTACLFADVNCDCRIDVEDVMAVASRWGMTDDDPDWDGAFDLDPNGRINIVDVQIVAGRWGVRCDAAIRPTREDDDSGGAGASGERAIGRPVDDDASSTTGGGQPSTLAGGGTIELAVSDMAPDVGDRVTFTLSVRGALDLAAFEIALAADPARLTLVEAKLGDFLGSAGRIALPLGPQSDGAVVRFGGFTLPGAAAASGDGVVATLEFEVAAAGPVTVQVIEGALVDGRSERTGAATAPLGIIAGGAIAVEGKAYLPKLTRPGR